MVSKAPPDFSSLSDPAPTGSPPIASASSLTRRPRWKFIFWCLWSAILMLSCFISLAIAWKSQTQIGLLEQELVRRQEASQNQSLEAQTLSRQSSEMVRDSVAKVALLEAKLAELSLQRVQLEELVQSLYRSRDENLVADIESAIRVAIQQSAITGSSEPLVAVLKQSDERLTRAHQPRLQGVQRAILRDLDRLRAAGSVDVSMLTLRLDESVALIDSLPLLSAPKEHNDLADTPQASKEKNITANSPSSGAGSEESSWLNAGRVLGQKIWAEVKTLVRVSRIDQPDAFLLAPEQSFFLRENLKLRLLHARLALLSRQFETVQSDLKRVQEALSRYFDPQSRRTIQITEILYQVAGHTRMVSIPRPDDTLAALAMADPGR